MFQNVDFTAKAKLSLSYPTTIKFGEDHEFTVTWKFGSHCIEKIKGDLEITNVTAVSVMSGCDTNVNFNKSTNSFYSPFLCYGIFTFYITANVEMEEILAFNFQIHLSAAQLKPLEVNQYIDKEIVSPLYPDFEFTYYVNKIGSEGKNIEIYIENPYHDFKIQGEKGDYKSLHSDDEDISLELSFVYCPPIPEKLLSVSVISDSMNFVMKEIEAATNDVRVVSPQTTVAEESRPQSALPTLPDNQFNQDWCKILLNGEYDDNFLVTSDDPKIPLHRSQSVMPYNEPDDNLDQYADAFLIASNGAKIPAHSCFLEKFSPIFEKIMNETVEFPKSITVEDFDAETIKAVMDFFIEKRDSIVGKEEKVFKFAVKYRIQTIMEACRTYFEKSVNPSNVCEYIQIAYSNDFEELKQKCLEILVEKKNEIDASKFDDLSKNILCDF